MSALNLSNLGTLVRKKRGELRLRDVAEVVGISAATLMRVENGRIPDVTTFGKLCAWLEVDPGDLLGFKPQSSEVSTKPQTLFLTAHFRTKQTVTLDTANALAKMLVLVNQSQPDEVESILADENS
jgi:DNA-binding Xre family transcriptional regulator